MSKHTASFYNLAWRWHFYAGLFVLPFILILSVTGAIYLFKPQIQHWEERAWMGLAAEGGVSPDRQRDAALSAFPGARFGGYRLPERAGDSALIRLVLADGGARDVFVSPQGGVLGALDPETRIAAIVRSGRSMPGTRSESRRNGVEVGQEPAQMPQETHRSGSTTASPSNGRPSLLTCMVIAL